jgi:hypothetical protein
MVHKLVSLALALAVSLALASPAWALPDAVRVVYAQPFSYAAGGFTWSESYIQVHTKNLGTPASRHVYLHYRNGSVWSDQELTLIGTFSDHSTYRVTHPSPSVEFAVKYVTSAGTYWDNNDGANYKIQPYVSSGGYLAGDVGYEVGLTSSAVSDYAYFTGTGWASAAKLTVASPSTT